MYVQVVLGKVPAASDVGVCSMPAVSVPGGCEEAFKSFELAWRPSVQRFSLAAVEVIMPSDGLQVLVDSELLEYSARARLQDFSVARPMRTVAGLAKPI